jgi:hypothetical protein
MENTIPEFGKLISNVVQREIMFHLGDPTGGIRAIKFVHIHSRKEKFPLKGMGLKIMRMVGCLTFKVQRLVR